MRKVNPNILINWWLEKYHNTNLDKILEENPEWKENPREHTREFYERYQVTKAQHDEWEKWAKEYTRKVTKASKYLLERGWGFVYLDTAPSIIKE